MLPLPLLENISWEIKVCCVSSLKGEKKGCVSLSCVVTDGVIMSLKVIIWKKKKTSLKVD